MPIAIFPAAATSVGHRPRRWEFHTTGVTGGLGRAGSALSPAFSDTMSVLFCDVDSYGIGSPRANQGIRR